MILSRKESRFWRRIGLKQWELEYKVVSVGRFGVLWGRRRPEAALRVVEAAESSMCGVQ